MSNNGGFDPVSFSAGIGMGQEATNRANSAAQNAEHAAAMARIEATGAQDSALALAVAARARQVEIEQKWIPYGVQMQASIFARRVQKEELIAALKAADPTNADRIVQETEQHVHAEYARLTEPGSEALRKINEEVHRKAEEGRLDR